MQVLDELLTFAAVSISVLETGVYFVSVRPKGHAPLWWYGKGATLAAALDDAKAQTITARFLK